MAVETYRKKDLSQSKAKCRMTEINLKVTKVIGKGTFTTFHQQSGITYISHRQGT
jgi:hypothetical protein